jgi:RND family efflux transporter MFP subunit
MSESKATNKRAVIDGAYRNGWWFAALAAIVVVAGIAIFTWRGHGVAGQEEAAPAAAANNTGRIAFLMEQQWLIKMKLAKAEEAELAPQIRTTGRIVPVPANRAIVAPPVGGILQGSTLPRIGQQVRQGQRLGALIQTPTAAEAAQIQIENTRIETERRRLTQLEVEAEARLEEATHDLGRSRRLFEKKAYSAKALESDELARTAAAAQLEAVREQLKALHPVTAANMAYEIHAPIAGTIVGVNKSNGEQVAPGEAILEIVALATVWVEAPIFEKDLGKIAPDVRAAFTTTAFPDKEFQGRLVSINKVIDQHSRTAKAIFEVPNTAGELSIGMQANLRLDSGSRTSVLLIPREAVLDNEGRKIVYVLLSGEEFERREVVVGDEYGPKVAILSGVKPGERVVTQGAYQLKLQELRPANAGEHSHEV